MRTISSISDLPPGFLASTMQLSLHLLSSWGSIELTSPASSIFITSAPKVARYLVATGPATTLVRSATLSSDSGKSLLLSNWDFPALLFLGFLIGKALSRFSSISSVCSPILGAARLGSQSVSLNLTGGPGM